MSEQCLACPIAESCPLPGLATYCSGMIDVTLYIEAIRKGMTTVDEVADMLCEIANEEADKR